MAKGYNKEGVRRALHLMKYILEHQGQRRYKELGGVPATEIFKTVYADLKYKVDEGNANKILLQKRFREIAY